MKKEDLRAYKIVSRQFLTMLRIEFSTYGNHVPLGAVVQGLQCCNIPIRFLSSNLSTDGSMTFNIGVDLLSEEVKRDVLSHLGTLQQRREVSLISQVSMVMLYGPHFGEMPGIAGAAHSSLARAGVVPLATSASTSSISYLFSSSQFKAAVEVLTEVFQPPEVMVNWGNEKF